MTLRTIIVDDEPLARDLLRALLAEHADINVAAQCQDGQEAISYLQTKPVDLMFLDVQMPGLDGLGTLRQLKSVAATRDIPVVVAAGGADRLTPVPHARRIAAELPGAKLVIYPGAGHMLPYERDLDIAALVRGLVELART